MQRLALLALRLNRKVQIDRHPLARADGGWYPGKHFDPTDVLTDPKNWLVWRQFIIFFSSILFLPVGVFLGVEYLLRVHFGCHVNKSTTVGAVLSMLVLQGLMLTYARLAAIENTDDDQDESAGAPKLNDEASGLEVEIVSERDASTAETAAPAAAEDAAAEETAAREEVAASEDAQAEAATDAEAPAGEIVCDGNVCTRVGAAETEAFSRRVRKERI